MKMISGFLGTLLRTLGLFIAVGLAISPWIIAVDVEDLFLNQSWMTFGFGFLAVTVLSVVSIFGRPRRGQMPYLFFGLVLWLGIAVSVLMSPFLNSLRLGLLICTQLLLFFFLRGSLRFRDTGSISWIIFSSGTMMGLFTVMQYLELDSHFLNFIGMQSIVFELSPSNVSGVFGNPNYLAAYLMTTSLLGIGMFFRARHISSSQSLILVLGCGLQIAGLFLSGSAGAVLCFGLGIILFYSDFWESGGGDIFRRNPFSASIGISMLFFLGYFSVYIAASAYPWENVGFVPYGHLSILARLLIWQMAFASYLQAPFSGLGPGGFGYLLSGFRSPQGVSFGLAYHNDDPHSIILTLMGETGLISLLGFCGMLVVFVGIHSWRRFSVPVEVEDSGHETQERASLVARGDLSRAFAVPAICLFAHGLFNTTLSVLPLGNLFLLFAVCHQAACLRDLRWRWGFYHMGFLFLGFPLLYGSLAWVLQSSHATVVSGLRTGRVYTDAHDFVSAEREYRRVLDSNPQSLMGLWGLAVAMEGQGKLSQTQDLLSRLDEIGPNVFGVRYHLARVMFQRNLILEAHHYALKSLANNRTPSSYELLGRILLAEGRFEEAEQVLREGLFLVPFWKEPELHAFDQISIRLASITVSRGEFDEASKYLKAISRNSLELPEVNYLKGLVEFNRENFELAVSSFERALSADPGNPHYLNALGYLLIRTSGDLERAQSLLRQSFDIFKSGSPVRLDDILKVCHSLGMLYWRLGDLDRAHELLFYAYSECPSEQKALKSRRKEDLDRFVEETGRSAAPPGQIE